MSNFNGMVTPVVPSDAGKDFAVDTHVTFLVHGQPQTGVVTKQLKNAAVVEIDETQKNIAGLAMEKYNEALERGIAKECARVLLPLATQTKLYMKGSVRSWIHYLEIRTLESTQKEHREIAIEIKHIFSERFPAVSKALGWS